MRADEQIEHCEKPGVVHEKKAAGWRSLPRPRFVSDNEIKLRDYDDILSIGTLRGIRPAIHAVGTRAFPHPPEIPVSERPASACAACSHASADDDHSLEG
jgi:hypothetical protein